jgi:hypothetical protein
MPAGFIGQPLDIGIGIVMGDQHGVFPFEQALDTEEQRIAFVSGQWFADRLRYRKVSLT